ncbi:adenosine deaminase [Leifsonia sp. 98AMF]|uniref:adenosine deaminase n=1 Tax=unclassified Leifsonia TaxID=2663824 RepID=UPI00087B5BB7|nr:MULTISPECIES: adenosine deaminase [unclassified Leifsonia]SDH28232.1 adenosine deaminase [Leifsonia sp. 197AMF]SDJ10182.1 adenosine deaminase [Leifsonia sp. 466MF]SDJ60188.1 adenosine deaminase [Leifsonia sp. 157MF]SDN31465.1 adenosine deaminase [Leifsonia sp. 509MF]SEM89923.1 adenosine deaminase [Leifsonia sp. 467MF]
MTDDALTDDALNSLPKAELHLHIEGTLEPELAFELAARNGIDLPYATVEELSAQYDFDDLQSFLNLYYATMAVLRTREDFAELTRRYLRRAHAQGVRHAELFFDPQAHTSRGVAFDDVVDGIGDALDEAERDLGMSGGLILCFLRDQPVDSAEEALTAGLRRTDRIVGVGLDSAEVGYPPSLFEGVYARARAAGLHAVAHAGEEGPPAYVREALDLLHAERIDHGIRSIEDPELVARLAEERIPLTVCPLSNVRLQATPDVRDHPLHRLDAAGVRVTVNSDDPAYFGGYVGQNFAAVRDALGLSVDQARRFARTSIEASFASDARKAELFAELDGWNA